MAIEKWELYLDESGEFEDHRLRSDWNPSLAGGLLCTEGAVTAARAEKLCGGQNLHANENRSEDEMTRNFGILRTLRQDSHCRFVFFENTEHLMIVNGDTTYLNIVAEGIVRLLRDLAAEKKAQEIEMKVCVAWRKDVERLKSDGVSVYINEQEYEARLQERMVFAMGGTAIPNARYSLSFSSARRDSRLMLADLICNYYQTRAARTKFTPAQRDELSTKLFDAITLYPVFEESTVRMARRLMAEDNIGDAMVVMASAKSKMPALAGALAARLLSMSARERELHFRRVSLQIGVYADKRLFEEGRRFAERYRERLLAPMLAYSDMAEEIGRWMFDTDFYLLTMADHMGDAKGCELYGQRCRENIGIVMQGWEQLDYYFSFCIRENNVLMGRFDFEGVLKRTARLEGIAVECHTLADLVREDMGIESDMRSVSIGKLMGQRVEAYANLLGGHPEWLEDALRASDQALSAFRLPEDCHRQVQYRAALYLRVNQPKKALAILAGVSDVGEDIVGICEKYLKEAEEKPAAARSFD